MASEPTGTQAIDRAAQLLCSVVEAVHPPSVGELATRPDCRRAPRRGSSARSSGRASSSGSASAAACTRGRCCSASRPETRRPRSSSRRPLAAPPRRCVGRDDQPRDPRAARRRAPRAGRHGAHRRRRQLGRPAGAAPCRRERQGLPRARHAADRAARPADAAHDRRPRAARGRARARSRPRLCDEHRRARARALRCRRPRLRSLSDRGDAFAALSISGPTARLTSERIASLAPLLIEESNKLAPRLGHREHARGAA